MTWRAAAAGDFASTEGDADDCVTSPSRVAMVIRDA